MPCLVQGDDAHVRAIKYMGNAACERRRLVTTDYVLNETATLLKARVHGHIVPRVLADILESQSCRIVWMDADLFRIRLSEASEGEVLMRVLVDTNVVLLARQPFLGASAEVFGLVEHSKIDGTFAMRP